MLKTWKCLVEYFREFWTMFLIPIAGVGLLYVTEVDARLKEGESVWEAPLLHSTESSSARHNRIKALQSHRQRSCECAARFGKVE